jgi:hypothetical protein
MVIVKPEDLIDLDPSNRLGNLIAPAGFNFKTSKTLNISVVLPNNGTIQSLIITNSSGTKDIFKISDDRTT